MTHNKDFIVQAKIRAVFEKHTIPEAGDTELLMFDTDAIIAELTALHQEDLKVQVADAIREARQQLLTELIEQKQWLYEGRTEFDIEAVPVSVIEKYLADPQQEDKDG